MRKQFLLSAVIMLLSLIPGWNKAQAQDVLNHTLTVNVAQTWHVNVYKMSDFEPLDISSPISIASGEVVCFEAADSDCSIEGVTVNGTERYLSGDGKLRIPLNTDTTVDIVSSSTRPVVTFTVTDASHIAVFDNVNPFLIDITSPVSIKAGTVINIEPMTNEYLIESVTVNGVDVAASGNGRYEVTISADAAINVVSKPNKPLVTFEVTNPSHVNVYLNSDNVNIDVTKPAYISSGELLTIESAGVNYVITSVVIDGNAINASGDGRYRYMVQKDMTVRIESKSNNPIVTFDIDFASRVNVLDIETYEPFDISAGFIQVASGKTISLEATDAKYTIETVLANGNEVRKSGNGAYFINVTNDMTLEVKTKSSIPGLKFTVDNPERINVWMDDAKLDTEIEHEVERGTQLVIESAGADFGIVSVKVNGGEIKPLSDGKYYTSVMNDINISIITKGIIPVMMVNADHPKRISVVNNATQEVYDISSVNEVAVGTEVLISSVADNFSITSVKADGKDIEAQSNGSYLITVNADIVIDVTTFAVLTLNTQTTDGGTYSVYIGDKEVFAGEKLNEGDTLTFSYTFEEGYAFDYFTVNGNKLSEKYYVVTGSDDINIEGVFRTIPETNAMVTFIVDDRANVMIFCAGIFAYVDVPMEVAKGSRVSISNFGGGRINSVTANGVNLELDPEYGNYTYEVMQNVVIRIESERRCRVSTSSLYVDGFGFAGDVKIRYNDEVADNFYVRAGETVELINEAYPGYKFMHYRIGYSEDRKYYENTYTVTYDDVYGDGFVTFFGYFDIDNAVNNVKAEYFRYDEASETIITGGNEIMVYSLTGNCVISSSESEVSAAHLPAGIYIVKSGKNSFKFVR